MKKEFPRQPRPYLPAGGYKKQKKGGLKAQRAPLCMKTPQEHNVAALA